MLDLNATMFYKAKFSISTAYESDDLLWKLVLHIRDWLTTKWNKESRMLSPYPKDWTAIKRGGRLYSDASDKENSVFIESEYYHAEGQFEQYWACRITERRSPKAGYSPRMWTTEVGYEQIEKNSAVFSCVLTFSDVPGFIGPCEDAPGHTLPGLISNLLSDSTLRCFSGSDGLAPDAQRLEPGDWPAFWTRLCDPQRELPYIYISPRIVNFDTRETANLISPSHLAYIIRGNALVFYAQSPDITEEMNFFTDDHYVCYGGAIRIYLPKLDTSNPGDSFRHRYITTAFIEENGETAVMEILRRAFGQDVHFYESFFRIDNCRDKIDAADRERRILDLQRRHTAKVSELEDQSAAQLEGMWNDAEEELNRRLAAEKREERLKEEVDSLQTERYILKNQLDSCYSAITRCRELEASLQSRNDISSLPDSPEAVVQYFKTVFGDKIAFSQDAMTSLKGCTLRPSEMWRVFFGLATVLRDLYENGNPDIYGTFKKQTGIDCASGEGAETRKDKSLMRQFETTYNGETVDIEPHVTFGRQGQSIHFGYYPSERKVVVGHCGEHLEIYSTRRRK